MARQLTKKERRRILDRFEAAGVSLVQSHLASGAMSDLVDTSGDAGVREIATKWVAERLRAKRRRRRRNDALLIIASVAAALGAIFSFFALI